LEIPGKEQYGIKIPPFTQHTSQALHTKPTSQKCSLVHAHDTEA